MSRAACQLHQSRITTRHLQSCPQGRFAVISTKMVLFLTAVFDTLLSCNLANARRHGAVLQPQQRSLLAQGRELLGEPLGEFPRCRAAAAGTRHHGRGLCSCRERDS